MAGIPSKGQGEIAPGGAPSHVPNGASVDTVEGSDDHAAHQM